jgi:CRISPR type III-B/RAMP module RAMP protein Cmr6
MADSCRAAISNWWKQEHPAGANSGLLRDRYLRVAVKDKANHPGARKDLFNAMCQSVVQSNEIYQIAYLRHVASLEALSFQVPNAQGLFITKGRMVIGLGGENVLETGLTLHHTYGTPLIPGTALKGLASHYCDQVWGAREQDQGFKRWKKDEKGGEYHKAIFGTTEDSGHIIFHDAWITPETMVNSLQPDVMTPHHGDYYSGKGAPTDFDDPNPVTFLSVVGTFHVVVSCDVPEAEGQKWAKLAFDLLAEALDGWGIGGKTNAGYGRLVREDRDEGGAQLPIEAELSATPSLVGPGPQKPTKPTVPVTRKLKYKKGDTVEVTRIADPKEKRGAAYFMADDGIGGLVVQGTAPSVEMGKKTKLAIAGVMEKEGLYNFAASGAKKDGGRQVKDRRVRR